MSLAIVIGNLTKHNVRHWNKSEKKELFILYETKFSTLERLDKK